MMRKHDSGFTLVEVMLAMFLIAIGVLAAAPMFIYAMQGNAAGGDMGSVGAIAVEQMELLRSQAYSTLVAGGDIDVSTVGYTANIDAVNDNTTFTVNWEIADNAAPVGSKTIVVRVVADRQVVGQPKEVVLSSVRGR